MSSNNIFIRFVQGFIQFHSVSFLRKKMYQFLSVSGLDSRFSAPKSRRRIKVDRFIRVELLFESTTILKHLSDIFVMAYLRVAYDIICGVIKMWSFKALFFCLKTTRKFTRIIWTDFIRDFFSFFFYQAINIVLEILNMFECLLDLR